MNAIHLIPTPPLLSPSLKLKDTEWSALMANYVHNRLRPSERLSFELLLHTASNFETELKPILLAEIALRMKIKAQQLKRLDKWFEEAKMRRQHSHMFHI
ncbi:MAG: hypothetical protein AAFQ83_00855 [Bacteroidota bacterium]